MNVALDFVSCSLDELKALLDGGSLTVYSVARPITADQPVERSGTLATFTFAIARLRSRGGRRRKPESSSRIPSPASSVGTPGFARARKADGTVIADFSAGPGDREIKFGEVSFSQGAPVKLATFKFNPEGGWPERPEYYDTRPRTGFRDAQDVANPPGRCQFGDSCRVSDMEIDSEMTYANPEALVSTEWLAEHLSDPDVRILDCTWHHASTNLDGRTQYRGRHLPGSVHFDIDHIADKSNPLPHMLPDAADFAKKSSDYWGSATATGSWSTTGCAAGPRRRGRGGCSGCSVTTRSPCLKAATANGPRKNCPTDMSMVRPEQKSFSATYNPALVRGLREMRDNLATAAEQVIDARGPAKFDGTQEDVFPFKKLGHIPNATNIPWADLIHPDTGAFIAPDALAATICRGRDRS